MEQQFAGPAVSIIYYKLMPDNVCASLQRPKTALQLLQALNIPEEAALVIRNGGLLTPDRRIWPGDQIEVRMAGSRG